jgi:hypothetical protein
LVSYDQPRRELGKRRDGGAIAGLPELTKSAIQSVSTPKKSTGRKRRR